MLAQSAFTVNADENNKNQISDNLKTTANCIVVDAETGLPISSAVITYSVLGSTRFEKIKTDKDGKFMINSIETGFYNWTVEAEAYKIGLFNGYPVISGGNNYFFEISKNNMIELNYTRQMETIGHNEDMLDNNNILHVNKSVVDVNNSLMSVPQDPPTIANYNNTKICIMKKIMNFQDL